MMKQVSFKHSLTGNRLGRYQVEFEFEFEARLSNSIPTYLVFKVFSFPGSLVCFQALSTLLLEILTRTEILE